MKKLDVLNDMQAVDAREEILALRNCQGPHILRYHCNNLRCSSFPIGPVLLRYLSQGYELLSRLLTTNSEAKVLKSKRTFMF